MPVLTGVLITKQGAGPAGRKQSKGVYVLDKSQSRQVEELFADTARYTGRTPPGDFTLQAGEIFYEGGKMVELRMCGNRPVVKVKGVKYLQPWWHAGGDFEFDLTADFGLALAPQDQGRTHIAAYRIGPLVIISWDLSEGSRPRADADARVIRIVAERNDRGGRAGAVAAEEYETAILYTDLIVKAALELRKLLTGLRDGKKVDSPGRYKAFRLAFKPLLNQQAGDESAGAPARGRLSIKRLGESELKQRLLEVVTKSARESFSAPRGRPEGSRTKNRRSDVTERDRARKEDILRALAAEYKTLRRTFEPADAEAKITRAKVAERMGKDRGTLRNWFKEGGWEFDDLRTAAIESAEKNEGVERGEIN